MPCETDAIYLFIVMLHATIRNLNCFTNNQILHILNSHLHLLLSLKAPHEATAMLNLSNKFVALCTKCSHLFCDVAPYTVNDNV